MFIKLTTYDDDPILVNTDTITKILQRPSHSIICFNATITANVRTVTVEVKESLEEIELKITNCNRIGNAVTQ